MQAIARNVSLSGAIDDDVREILAQILIDARLALPASPIEAEACIKRASAILTQLDGVTCCDVGGVNRGGLAPWQARRAEAMIEKRLGEKLSVGTLAEAVRLSPGHFRRAFRHTFGIAPHGYILRRRIHRAKELMQTTSDALADIALACGLADQSHFSTAFRRIEGETPNAWRRRHFSQPVSAISHISKVPAAVSL
jgi:AraC family transcriptional regulator